MYQIKATSNEIVQFVPESFSELYNKMWNEACHFEKAALVLAYTERVVSHARLFQFSDKHTKDIGDCLQKLEREGRLTSTGSYRAKTYHLPHQSAPSPEDVFDSLSNDLNSPNSEISSPNSETSSTNNDPSSPNSETSSTNNDQYGRVLHDSFKYPFVDKIDSLSDEYRKLLEKKAMPARKKQRVNPEVMKSVILDLCQEQYVTAGALAILLQRELATLRGQYLVNLKAEGKLDLAFPRTANDPRQAYLTVT